jgi:hypothetical protein
MIDDAATPLLAERLRAPLQIEQHLTLAFERGFRRGEKLPTPKVRNMGPVFVPLRSGADAVSDRRRAPTGPPYCLFNAIALNLY